jgi:hypothetical protein
MTDLTLTYVSPELRKGMDLVEKGELARAYQFFQSFSEKEKNNPVAISFLGYLTASFQQRPYQGLELCLESVKADKEDPLIYLNLARVYIQLNDRYHAVQAIQHGLKYRHSPFRANLMNFYRFIGIRQKAVVPFLHRNHPINKFVGKMMRTVKREK